MTKPTAKRPSARKPTAKKTVEWTAGVVRMPAPVRHEDGSIALVVCLVWVSDEGFVLGHRVEKPEELSAHVVESFRKAVAEPTVGAPHRPDVIRVASAELAEALAGCGVEVAFGIKPEVDALLAQMRAHFEGKHMERPPLSYLSGQIDSSAVAAFFRACAALYRAKPWKVISSDRAILSLTIEALEIRDAVLSVVGQLGESFGVLMFDSRDDFDAFSFAAKDGVDELDDDELDARNVEMPAIFSINFERGADLDSELRKEIATHRWEVANANAYPHLVLTEAGMVQRWRTPTDLALAEAIAEALSKLVHEKKAVKKAIEEGERMVRSYSVVTHQGAMEVKLALPFDEPQLHTGLLADLEALECTYVLGDDSEFGDLCDALLTEFDDAPEAVGVQDRQASAHVMGFASSYFESSVASLSAEQLDEIVFEIIPRKVAVRASDAPEMIAELRAFYAFLKRAYALKQADACLRVLGGDAAERLAAKLGDASSFGMAKTIVDLGARAGFDMSSEDGVHAWMAQLQKTGMKPSLASPSASKKRASPAKAKQRKEARKARKKNR